LLEDAKEVVRASIAKAAGEGATDFDTMRRHCRKSLARFIDERTRRRPQVIPVVMEV
jgi:ribonuclease J